MDRTIAATAFMSPLAVFGPILALEMKIVPLIRNHKVSM
jgi:hypothetical protein